VRKTFTRKNEFMGVYEDDTYRVEVKKHPYGDDTYFWADINRKDGSTVLSWSDLQGIKNDIFGVDSEAVMLFPAEERLVDEANHYHLFVLRDKTKRFDFGFKYRRVKDERGSTGN